MMTIGLKNCGRFVRMKSTVSPQEPEKETSTNDSIYKTALEKLQQEVLEMKKTKNLNSNYSNYGYSHTVKIYYFPKN